MTTVPATALVDYYELLGVAATASPEEIRTRLQQEIRAWVHKTNAPDLERRQAAERRVEDLSNAKRVLLDPARRSQYDAELKRRPPTVPRDRSPLPGAGEVTEAGEDLVARARAHLEGDDVASAVYEARVATERQPGNPEAWAVLAEAKARWGKVDDAVYEYERAIDLRSNHATYHAGLAALHESQGHWGRALLGYERAARCEPADPRYPVAAGRIYVDQLKLYESALPLLEEAVAHHPENADLGVLLARVLLEQTLDHLPRAADGSRAPTTEAQARAAQAQLQRADALPFDDASLRAKIRGHVADVERALQEGWAYSSGTTAMVVALLVLLAAGIWFLVHPVLAIVVSAAATTLWVRQGRQPIWRINARRFGSL